MAMLVRWIAVALMALVREPHAFLLVAALAGVVWTVMAAELWLAAQRAMPVWARGRMNATVIMVSQGAMALGGIVWVHRSNCRGKDRTVINVFLGLCSVALLRLLRTAFIN